MSDWVDTHCHLQLDDRPADELLERAVSVDWLLVPGVDAPSSRAAAAIASAYPGRVEWSAGLHPNTAGKWRDQAEEIIDLAASAAAVGETGLDYYRQMADHDDQRTAFRAHVELALELRRPLIVHCRDAFADTYDILEETTAGSVTVMHCWTGGRRWTRRFMDLGVMFSFAGPITYETGETIRLAAELVPPERGLVETDTPYLAPSGHQSRRNEPEWVSVTGAVLADVWGIDRAEAARVTSANAARVFRRDR